MSDVLTRFEYIEHEDQPVIWRVQDCDPYVDLARRLRELPQGEWPLAAIIPHGIAELYMNTLGIDFHEFICNPEHIRALLNAREYCNFRVWEGKV